MFLYTSRNISKNVSEWELESRVEQILAYMEVAEFTTFVVDNLLRYTIKVEPSIDGCILILLECIEEGKSEASIEISNHCVELALSISSLSIITG